MDLTKKSEIHNNVQKEMDMWVFQSMEHNKMISSQEADEAYSVPGLGPALLALRATSPDDNQLTYLWHKK